MLPPYGARIREYVRQGYKPNVYITTGPHAWDRHQHRIERVVLPAETDPADYDWSFMRGLAPTVIGDGTARVTLRKLAWCLLSAGCVLVCVTYIDAIGGQDVVLAQFYRND